MEDVAMKVKMMTMNSDSHSVIQIRRYYHLTVLSLDQLLPVQYDVDKKYFRNTTKCKF